MKKLKTRYRRGLQFSYKNHLHPMSYRRVMIFRRFSRNKLFQVIKKDLYIEVMYDMKSYDENLCLVKMCEKLYF